MTERGEKMFSVTQRKGLMAFHFNPKVDGEEGAVHSHPYTIAVTVAGEKLDENSLLLDVNLLERSLNLALSVLNGKVLNELPEFLGSFPSIENLAYVIWLRMLVDLDPSRIEWLEVTVWEDVDISAAYKERVPSRA
jgi:6-pyruvoyltetrahydropterin/6-carboxytetrahydropterin synthase